MKKYLFVFTFLLFINQVISQNLDEKDIAGKWKVVKILNKPENTNIKELIKSLSTATFEFNTNTNFKLTTTNKTKLFKILTDKAINSKWKLNKSKSVINVGTNSDSYSFLKIIVIELNSKIIFHLFETNLDLEVEKERT